MKRFHLALGVSSVEESVVDYSARLDQQPDIVIPNEYALWRTPTLNFSIRKVSQEDSGKLRHLGWESPDTAEFSTAIDVNHIPWERFTTDQQEEEIRRIWPNTHNYPKH